MNCKQCYKNFVAVGKEKICSDECRKIRLQIYYKHNKEKAIERVRIHRQRSEYKIWQNQWNKKWREKNREKVLQMRIKSQKKIYDTLKKVGFVTNEIRHQIYTRDSFKCLCCGTSENLSIDHIIPISLGGTTTLGNLQTLCKTCNSRKQQDKTDYTKKMI